MRETRTRRTLGKRAAAAMLAFCMVFTLLPTTARAAATETLTGFSAEDGASLPEITAAVALAEQTATEKGIAMIDALPTMDEWMAMAEDTARAVMNEILAAKSTTH